MDRIKRSTFLVLCLLCVLATSTAGAQEAQDGETLRVAYPQRLADPDPHGATATERITIIISRHIFDTLVAWDPEAGEYVSELATEWTSVDDHTWRFQLREGVEFHDGTEFTSEDVQASVQRVQNLSGPLSPLFRLVEVQAPEPHVVVFKTAEPMGTLLGNLTQLPIVPEWALEDDNFSEKLVGTGAFTFVEWITDTRFVIEANEDYWREDLPKVERIVFVDIPETTARLTALSRGEIDLTVQIPPENLTNIREQPDLNLAEGPTPGIRSIWINPDREPLDDPKVRRAMWHALDIDAMVEGIVPGVAVRATAPVAQNVLGYSEMPAYQYDPELARQLLVEAGYPDGFEIGLLWNEADVKSRELNQAILAYWNAVGIRAESDLQPRALWVDRLLALDWDTAAVASQAFTLDADIILGRLYHSSSGRLGYDDPEELGIDTLLQAAASTVNQEERVELYRQVSEYLWENAVTLFLFEPIENYAYRDRVQGFEVPRDQILELDNVSLE